MLGGLLGIASDMVAFGRGAVKVAMGTNPMQPTDIWSWLKQMAQGKAWIEEVRIDMSAPSILDGHSAPMSSGPSSGGNSTASRKK